MGIKKVDVSNDVTFNTKSQSPVIKNTNPIEVINTLEEMIIEALNTYESLSKLPKIGKVQEDYNSEINLEPYEKRIKEILEKSKTKREKVKNLAIFLSSEFPKLPYYEGDLSGHDGTDLKGLKWLQEQVNTYIGHRTLDCSGLVNWCFQNVGLEVPSEGRTWDYQSYVGSENVHSLVGCDLSDIQPGDFAHSPNGGGHMGIIVDVNTEQNEITVVHTSASGKGVNITTISTETGRIVSDDTGSAGVDRTGTPNYFTEILHVPYED